MQRTYTTMARPRLAVMQTQPPPPPVPIQQGIRGPAPRPQRPQMQQQPAPMHRARANSVRPQRMIVTSTPLVRPVIRQRTMQYAPRVIHNNGVQMAVHVQTPPPPRPPQANIVRQPVTQMMVTTVTESTTSKTPNPSNAFNVDLEDSISAAKIVKLAPTADQNMPQLIDKSISDDDKKVALTNGQVISLADFKRQQLLQQQKAQPQQVQRVTSDGKGIIRGVNVRPRARINASYAARAPMMQNVGLRQMAPPQPIQAVPLQQPPQLQQLQQQSPEQQIIEREPRESARMLVILQNGEQRLITFTLPKESCTVQELLEQVAVPFTPDTNIQCIPNPGVNIDYLVTVGVQFTEPASEIVLAAETKLQQKQLMEQQIQQQHQQQHVSSTISQNVSQQIVALQQKQLQSTTNLKPADPLPKYIKNMCAVCSGCGYSSLNHAQCDRCKRIFTEEPKKMLITTSTPKVKVVPSTFSSTQTTYLTTSTTEKQRKEMAAIQKRFQLNNAEAIKYVLYTYKYINLTIDFVHFKYAYDLLMALWHGVFIHCVRSVDSRVDI